MGEGSQQNTLLPEHGRSAARKGPFRRLALGLIILLLSQVTVSFLINFLVVFLGADGGWLDTMSGQVYITYGAMYLVGLPLMLRLIRPIPDHPPLGGVPLKLGLGELAALLAVLFAAAGSIATVMGELMGQRTPAELDVVFTSSESPWPLFIIVVIVAPVMEEYVFRYLPYRKLGGYDPRLYVLWTSIAFGLFHMDLVQSMYTMAVGLVLGVIMIKTGSLLYVIGLHMIFNLVGAWGFGGLILRSGSEGAVLLYGLFHLLLLVAGVIFGVKLFRRGFFSFAGTEPWTPDLWLPAFRNAGFVTLTLLCGGVIVVLLIL